MRELIERFRGEKGQALVELAFVIPLVLLFLFAIIDFGLAINQQNEDTNIANIAVREAAVIGSTTSAKCGSTPENTLSAWTTCEAATVGAPVPSLVCVYDTSTSSPSPPSSPASTSTYTTGDPVEVTIKSTFNWLHLIAGDAGGLVTSLGANATMREEGTISSANNTFLANPSGC